VTLIVILLLIIIAIMILGSAVVGRFLVTVLGIVAGAVVLAFGALTWSTIWPWLAALAATLTLVVVVVAVRQEQFGRQAVADRENAVRSVYEMEVRIKELQEENFTARKSGNVNRAFAALDEISKLKEEISKLKKPQS
jgi:membrane protein implicated in regulation of membrane protease activity